MDVGDAAKMLRGEKPAPAEPAASHAWFDGPDYPSIPAGAVFSLCTVTITDRRRGQRRVLNLTWHDNDECPVYQRELPVGRPDPPDGNAWSCGECVPWRGTRRAWRPSDGAPDGEQGLRPRNEQLTFPGNKDRSPRGQRRTRS